MARSIEVLKPMRSFLAPVRAMFLHLQKRTRRRQDEQDLRGLPDRVLHDLGIGRSEILACVRQGRDIDGSGDGAGA